MTQFVDADHAGDKKNHCYCYVILIYINIAPIIWYNKKHNTVESRDFGSEIVALQKVLDIMKGLCYKLRAVEVPIDGHTLVFCDNKSVETSNLIPQSTIGKNNLGI